MFVVEVGSVLTTALWIQALFGRVEAATGFIGAIALWLWFTVLFANFSEAVAEGRGKAQAESLRKARQDTPAKKLRGQAADVQSALTKTEVVSSTALRKNDLYLVEAGDIDTFCFFSSKGIQFVAELEIQILKRLAPLLQR